jgi:hypothetical protein
VDYIISRFWEKMEELRGLSSNWSRLENGVMPYIKNVNHSLGVAGLVSEGVDAPLGYVAG